MTEDRLVERCLHEPHLFTAWSAWTALQPGLSGSSIDDVPPPRPDPILAYRQRLCRRCDVVEEENYQGERKVVSDPHGIAALRTQGGNNDGR